MSVALTLVSLARPPTAPGIYRGITATALRDFPSFGVYFGLYHLFVEQLEGRGVHPDDASPISHIIAGGAGGWVTA